MSKLEIIDRAIEETKNDGNLTSLVRVKVKSGHFICTTNHPVVLASTLNMGGKRDRLSADKTAKI